MNRTIRTALPRRAALGATALALTGAAALAACSAGGGGHTGAASAMTAARAGTRVTVTETEYSLKLSRSSFTPGTYTFTAHDTGRLDHALEIDGPGVSDVRTGLLQTGHTGTLTVTLKKGAYELYCPVPGHRQLGMVQHIEVR
ncbi:copper-binding protein [Streptomyces sp. NPDC047000]|uniref:copper-binding protein n=1 Tax=Streptomyces sp. NPDC047000 TaxID=3155474 RepID=UPI0033E2B78C